MLKKLLITGGVAFVGYVINEKRKEYEKRKRLKHPLRQMYGNVEFHR